MEFPDTSATHVHDLARLGNAHGVLEQWSSRATREDQKKLTWVNAYYEPVISRAEVEWALQRSENALRGISAKDVPDALRDARVNYPLSFLVRGAMQSVGEVPTVDQFIVTLRRYPEYWAADMWKVAECLGYSKAVAWKACKYRASVAWQSWLRELHAWSGLRSLGLPIRSHPLADVVLKIDGWMENHLFSVFVENEYFRDRKEATPLKGPFVHHLLIAPKQPGNPGVWLVPDERLERVALRIDEVESGDGQARSPVLE